MGERLRLVRQEHTWGCGVAALAMVTGQTYDEVRTWILDHWTHAVTGQETPDGFLEDHGVTQYVLDWYLAAHGYAWQRLYRAWTSGAWPPEPFAPVHVAQVVQPSGMAHFVVLRPDGQVLDPMSDTPRTLADWEKVNHVQGIWSIAARADRLAGKVRALTDEWEAEGVSLIEHCDSARDVHEGTTLRVSARLLRALLDDEPIPDRPPLPDRVDAVLRRSRNMREGLVEVIESGELAP